MAQTKHNAKQRSCRRPAPLVKLTFAGHAGANKVKFAGQISSRQKLEPGVYTLAITATAAGETSTPHALKFMIETPPKPQSGGHRH